MKPHESDFKSVKIEGYLYLFNRELIAKAHEILDGVPDEVIKLDYFYTKLGRNLSCNTMCCGIGWLSYHTVFQTLGLRPEVELDEMTCGKFDGQNTDYMNPFVDDSVSLSAIESWCSRVFGQGSFRVMFVGTSVGSYDDYIINVVKKEGGLSDKELLLYRLKLAYYGQREFEKRFKRTWRNEPWSKDVLGATFKECLDNFEADYLTIPSLQEAVVEAEWVQNEFEGGARGGWELSGQGGPKIKRVAQYELRSCKAFIAKHSAPVKG